MTPPTSQKICPTPYYLREILFKILYKVENLSLQSIKFVKEYNTESKNIKSFFSV